MYQAILETTNQASLQGSAIQPVTVEMRQLGFCLEHASPNQAVYRDGDRYTVFALENGELTLRLGVGSHDSAEALINSMRLDELVAFMYGGLRRGCHATTEHGLERCLASAMKDLKEFAHEFLRGDFRPFLRVLALKKREDRQAATSKESVSKQIYLA